MNKKWICEEIKLNKYENSDQEMKQMILPRKNGHESYAAFSSCSSYCFGV